MPFNRFILLLASVIFAAGLTVWVAGAALPQAGFSDSGRTLLLLVPLVGYGLWRLISGRSK